MFTFLHFGCSIIRTNKSQHETTFLFNKECNPELDVDKTNVKTLYLKNPWVEYKGKEIGTQLY